MGHIAAHGAQSSGAKPVARSKQMKLVTLTTSALVLSASLMTGAAAAPTTSLVFKPGVKACWINGQQLFGCHYLVQRHYRQIPPTFDPNDVRKEVGNEGGGNEKGGGGRNR